MGEDEVAISEGLGEITVSGISSWHGTSQLFFTILSLHTR
jgi:hypothetical protein